MTDPRQSAPWGLDGPRRDWVMHALRDWLPGGAQCVLDEANRRITEDTDWAEDDDFAGRCEQLAVVARTIAEMGREADLEARKASG